jgi:AraC-like DNA-binding protein/SHS2 domain-containing protein
MKRINPILLRYLLMFFLFSGVLLLLFIPIFQYIAGFTLNNALSYIQDRLDRGSEILDTTLNTLLNAVVITGEDPRFRKFKYDIEGLDKEYFLLEQIKKDFNNLVFSQSIIADAGIIFSNDTVLSRYRFFFRPDLYTYYPEFFRCAQYSWEEWKSLLKIQSPFLAVRYYNSQDFGGYEGITYSSPWHKKNGGGESFFFATLPVKNILPLLADEDLLSHGFVRISDLEGNTILEYPDADRILPRNRYYILSKKSRVTPLCFEVGASKEAVQNKMAPVRWRLFLFALFITSFTMALSLLFAYKGSAPMRRLLEGINSVKYIKDEYKQQSKSEGVKPIQSFRRVYLDLFQSISVIDAKLDSSIRTIEEQSQRLRSMFFKNILRRGLYESDDLKNFRQVFPNFPKRFQIALISYEMPPDVPIEEKALLQIDLRNSISDFWRMDLFMLDMEQAIILILPIMKNEESWDLRIKELQKYINRKTKFGLNFSLSDVFEEDTDIYLAWQQVKFIRNVSGIDGMRSVGKMENLTGQRNIAPMVIAMLQMVYDSIKAGNERAASAILEETLSHLSITNDTVLSEMIYTLLSDLITFIKMETPSSLGSINVPVFVWDKREDLYKKEFPGCFEKICGIIRKNRAKSVSRLGKDILNYINENIYDPLLYIPTIADHFNISGPTLQKVIKNLTGETVSSYIEKKRLKKAWELLTTGYSTLADVAKESGFSSINSFYKTFKRIYGFSPGKASKNKE